jgi:hypothetical protein
VSEGNRLKRFSQIALAVLLVIAILIAAAGLLMALKRLSAEEAEFTLEEETSAPEQEAKGEVVHTAAERYAIFWQTGPRDARMDVSIVSMNTGDEVRLSERRAQQIFQFDVLNYPDNEDGYAMAYVALVRTGGTDDEPVCNLVIGRLDGLRQVVAERDIVYLDAPGATDASSISMVLTDKRGQTQFRIFDLKQMRFVGARTLAGSAVSAAEAARAAPNNAAP